MPLKDFLQRFFFCCLVGIITLLCVAGFTQTNNERKYGDAIVVASSSDARTLIPILASDSASSSICSLIYNGLVKYDKDLNIVGDLASHWDISKDGRTITFYLRRNVLWQDGVPFTARDVQFTYETIMDPNVATPYSGNFELVKSFEVIDDYTCRVVYKEPFAPGLISWGMGIMPQHRYANQDLHTTDFARDPIGTGPFRMKRWVTQQNTELIYSNDYFEHRPYLSRYISRTMPDEASQFLALQTKDIDFTNLSPLGYTYKTNTDYFQHQFRKFRLSGFGYTYLGFNLTHPLFTDRRVRIALDYAINKQEIIDLIFFGLAKPITGPFIVDSWAYDSTISPRAFDPLKAQELLASAGWSDTDNDGILDKEGVRFAFTITTNHGNDQRIKAAEVIQKRLADIGIKVKIRILEWSVFINECVTKKNFDAVLLGWSLTPDPDPYDIWHSSKTRPGEFNFIGFNNHEVDSLIVKARTTFDQELRKRYYHRIHQIIFDEEPYVFLYAPDSLLILDKRFEGIDPGVAGIMHNFIDWWVPKPQQRYKNVIAE